MNLAKRIAITIILFVILTGTLTGLFLHRQMQQSLAQEQKHWSESLSRAIAKATLSHTLDGNRNEVRTILRRVQEKNPDISYLVVVGFDGGVLSSTFDGKLPDTLSGKHNGNCINVPDRHLLKQQPDVLDIAYPLIAKLPAHIHLGIDQGDFFRSLTKLRWEIVVVVLLICLGATVPAFYIGKRVSRPIAELTGSIRTFGQNGSYHPPGIYSSDPEIMTLIESYANMVDDRSKAQKDLLEMNQNLEAMVTQRTRELELALESATIANQHKSEFLSRMSHELRTPMNAILGFSQLLAVPDKDETLSRLQQEYVNEILKAGKHLLDLINEVLDLARIESGKMEISVEPLDLAPIIDECMNLVQPLADHWQVTILPGNCRDHQAAVRADRVRLKQTLINLLNNAIKYNRQGGQVSIECMQADKTMRISIRDTGAGIPKNLQKRLFQPFDRLGAETSSIEGTGIGLSLTRALVELMHGKIGFYNNPDRGATFWIELNTGEMESVANIPQSGQPATDAQASFGKKCVLYVEDNPANLRLVEQVFARRKEIRFISTTSGKEGLELALQHKPDLVLLDINLPDIDGYTILKRLKAEPQTRNSTFIAITAGAMPADIERGMSAGFDDYITKPINLTEFGNMLDHRLREKP